MAVYEVVLSLVDTPGSERRSVGDIVHIRKPLGRIGDKETKEFMWIEMDLPVSFVHEFFDRKNINEKYPFKIELATLKQRNPDVSVSRSLDKDDAHQPFLIRDDVSQEVTFTKPKLRKGGLVIDKKLGVPVG